MMTNPVCNLRTLVLGVIISGLVAGAAYGQFPLDLAVSSVDSPGAITSPGPATVSATVENAGFFPLTGNVMMSLQLDGVTQSSETLPLNPALAAGLSISHTFATPLNLSIGQHTIQVTATLSTDGNPNNNSASISTTTTVIDIGVASIDAPGATSFAGLTNFAATIENFGSSSSDEITLDLGIDGTSALSTTIPAGSIASGGTQFVTFPVPFALEVGAHVITVTASMAGDQVPGNDSLTANTMTEFVDVGVTSIDSPGSTTAAGPTSVTATIENLSTVAANAQINLMLDVDGTTLATGMISAGSLLAGSSTPFTFDPVSLDPGAHVLTVSISMVGDLDANNDTASSPTVAELSDVGISTIVGPPPATIVGGYFVDVTVENFGTVPTTPVTVTIEFDGGVIQTQTQSGPIAPGGQFTVSGNAFLLQGSHTFTATVSMAGDQNPANDVQTLSTSTDIVDAEVVSIDSPGEISTAGVTPVTVTIRNNGFESTPAAIVLNVDLDGVPSGSLTLAAGLLSQTTDTVTFGMLDLTPGLHDIDVSLSMPGDLNSSNDLLTLATDTAVLVTDAIGYFEDFESGPGVWTTDAIWEHGTPSQNVLNHAFSGLNAWMTDLDANYPTSGDKSVYSPLFDFSTLTADPVIELAIIHLLNIVGVGDACRLEMDLGIGNGWKAVGNTDWYSGTISTLFSPLDVGWYGALPQWTKVAHRLRNAAGRSGVRLRMRFASDQNGNPNSVNEGMAFDDVAVYLPRFAVDSDHPYFEDFEQTGDGWYPLGVNRWERGSPAQNAISGAYSGSRAWMTNLDANHGSNSSWVVNSPIFDFDTLSEDPILSLAINTDTHKADGFRIEVNLGLGGEFQQLGVAGSQWLDGNIPDYGGQWWFGQGEGWRVVRHRITGAAGLSGIRMRMIFRSNCFINHEGAAFDDFRVYSPSRPGTQSTLFDDLDQIVEIDGVRDTAVFDGHDLAPGQFVEIITSSPNGALEGGMLFVLAEVFMTGATYAPILPEVFVSGGSSTFALAGGPQAPFGLPLTLAPGGHVVSFAYPGSIAGTSLLTQAIISSPLAENGIYASSDPQEIRLQ